MMSTPAKLWIVLGEDSYVKLILPSGIPDSVDNLKFEIQKHCGIEGEFRLQYMDNDFDQFMNLTSTADIQDKGTVKVIVPSEQSTQVPSHTPYTPFQGMDDSSADTDILSSSGSTSSTSTSSSSLRCQGWPRSLLSEVKKRNNHQVIKEKMEKTFAHRRHEVVQDMPFIAEFKSRWPALFMEHEISAEFTRITTIPLIPKFMSQLDHYSDKLATVLCKKGGGAAGN